MANGPPSMSDHRCVSHPVPHELTPVPAAYLTHPHGATRIYPCTSSLPHTPSRCHTSLPLYHRSKTNMPHHQYASYPFPVMCQIMAMRQPGFSLPGGASDGQTSGLNNRAASPWCWNCGKHDHLFEACPETTKAAAPRAAWNTPGSNLAAQGPYWRGHQPVPMSPTAAVQAGKEALAQWFGGNMHDEAGGIRLSWSNSELNVV